MTPLRVLALAFGLTLTLSLSVLGSGCLLSLFDKETERRATDEHFILLGNEVAPDGKSRIIVYQDDTGAFGYSRVWWAITPESFRELNLAKFELPDGYIAEGWSPEGELLISKWTPYYFAEGEERKVELDTGDMVHERKIRIVEKKESK